MSTFLSAYDTLAGRGHSSQIEKIKDELKVASINGDYVQDENKENVRRLYDHALTNIPTFGYPIILESKGEELLYVDLRSYTHLDRASGDYILKQSAEALLDINKALLNAVWVGESPQVLLNLSPLPMVCFAGLISETVARRFALTPREQLTLAIYSAYYYINLFTDDTEFGEEENSRIISSISRNLRCSSTDVFDALSRIESNVPDIQSFCAKMYDVLQTVRVKDFSAPVLFQIIGGAWFGLNARELVAISLEHPPTWIALVHAAYSDRTYRNTVLSKLAERKASRASSDGFLKAFYHLATQP